MSPNRRRTDLSIDEVRGLLAELGSRLLARGVEDGELYLVGGVAIGIEFDDRRLTADVDALFSPEAPIIEIVAEVAAEHGLPPNWLNSRARPFVPGGDHEAAAWSLPGLMVRLASPRHLLAMKMASYRPGRDQTDLELLFRALGITTAIEVADIALEVYGEGSVVVTDRDDLILSAQAILDRLAGPAGRRRPIRRGRGGS